MDKLMASPPRDTAIPALSAFCSGLILAFAPLFVYRSWRHAQLLLVSAILTPGRRTVTGVLRVMGRAHERQFGNVHLILNRALPTGSKKNSLRLTCALSLRPLLRHMHGQSRGYELSSYRHGCIDDPLDRWRASTQHAKCCCVRAWRPALRRALAARE